jgi:radical SAM family uncharacterized protein/radical SAM-linked protein
MIELEKILQNIEKPGRYIGNELNTYRKSFDASEVRLALAFPDVYEVGMSHIGLQVLYHTLNRMDGVMADRAYTPWPDLEEQLRTRGGRLCAMESGRPLKDFDILGVSLQYELSYTNILTILDLAGIPFYSSDRSDEHPWVIAGGPCAFNPEPLADIFDFIVVGEAEELLSELVSAYKEWKAAKGGRREFLEAVRKIPGIYVPSFFDMDYDADGCITGVRPRFSDYTHVQKRLIKDLAIGSPLVEKPLTPMLEIVHDRLSLEIARGCTRGCRFCQAGFIYRPVRERRPQDLLENAKKALSSTGFDELSLLSLSTGDYCGIQTLLAALMEHCSPQKVAVSFPSMRVGTLTPELMRLVRRVRKTGFTVAPEAATERLRRVINKGIRDEELLSTAENAFRLDWRILKLYFMIGLPTEGQEDIDAIIERCRQVWQLGKFRKASVNVAVSTFVPKAQTPFQWFGQIPRGAIESRLAFLKDGFRLPGLRLKWNHPGQSVLEAVFARGDRRLVKALVRAWELGARYDAWSDTFREDAWQRAFSEVGLNMTSYAERVYARDDILPWDHLSAGVSREFLWSEYERALAEEFTPDCRWEHCSRCGVCDHKTVQPLLHRDTAISVTPVEIQEEGEEAKTFIYRLSYNKTGKSRFFGQLEIARSFARAVHRAGLKAAYSKGYHPHLKMSFTGALPLGLESVTEEAYLTLLEEAGPRELLLRLNERLPEGIMVSEAVPTPKVFPRSPFQRVTYRVSGLTLWEVVSILRNVSKRLDDDIVKRTKRREIKVQMRKVLLDIRQVDETSLDMVLCEGPEVCFRPLTVLTHLLEGSSGPLSGCSICRIAVEPVEESDNVRRTYNQL